MSAWGRCRFAERKGLGQEQGGGRFCVRMGSAVKREGKAEQKSVWWGPLAACVYNTV
jgi:hypothetical protein